MNKTMRWEGAFFLIVLYPDCVSSYTNLHVLKLIELYITKQINKLAEVMSIQAVPFSSYLTTFCCHLCS